MKLELKHLAPYLPYGLKIDASYYDVEEIETVIGFHDIHGVYCSNMHYASTGQLIQSKYSIEHIKPILRPLSDLTKEIEHNGEKFAPFKWFNFINSDIDFETHIISLSNDVKWLDSTYYGIIEKLFEWHFDLFGLIEKGYAVDINTLNK